MQNKTLPRLLAALLAALAISACSPKFDWRDYRSTDAPYSVLFPGKPASHTRDVNLDGEQVTMTMTAAEIDGVMFAVGSAELPDAAKARTAAQAMKTAMLRNLDATVTSEKNTAASAQQSSVEIEAKGKRKGEPMLLVGRFIAQDKRVYQVIVVGSEKRALKDEVDTFMSSFKLN